MAMERRKVDSERREGIEESNEMGTEVLPTVDKKGKSVVHPMPEVMLPPTVEEEPKTRTVGEDERMEDPPSSKRRNYDHCHEEGGPTHFCKVILAPKLECIPMPLDFTKHFATVPTEFKLKNNTGCSWRVTVKLMNARINIGYMVTFKLLTPDTLKVIIFDDDGIEVVNKCGKHDEAFVARDYGRGTSFLIGLEGGTPALSGLVGQPKRALCAKKRKSREKKGRRWEGRGTPSHQSKSNSVWGGSPPPLDSADSLGAP
ncbi:hypothetical protein ZWY2020_013531 [Hordeum vulgare]|nr:hypothetical protein ZWY2020_013531 [Hordeum vulgare]